MKEFKGYKRGVNLGGWLSQCEHTKEHYDTFITEDDIKKIAGWGIDHVRLPIDYELVRDENGKDIESGYSYIDKCIEWCRKYNLNMILDLHKTAGFSFDAKGNSFFENKILQEKFVELWKYLAQRYGRYYEFLTFELLNEVVETEVIELWNQIIKKTITVIREHAPLMRIIIGGVRNNSVLYVSKLDMPFDENIIYTFHFYEPLIFTHQKAYWVDKMTEDYTTEYPNKLDNYIRDTEKYLPDMNREFYDDIYTPNADKDFIRASFADAVKTAEERNVPLYCGEYGVIDRADFNSALNWLTDMNTVFNEVNIPRAIWNYKGKDFGITDGLYSENLDKIIKLL